MQAAASYLMDLKCYTINWLQCHIRVVLYACEWVCMCLCKCVCAYVCQCVCMFVYVHAADACNFLRWKHRHTIDNRRHRQHNSVPVIDDRINWLVFNNWQITLQMTITLSQQLKLQPIHLNKNHYLQVSRNLCMHVCGVGMNVHVYMCVCTYICTYVVCM